MRLILVGSGEFGLATFSFLHEHHEVLAVVTQPDRPAGRGRRVQPTPVGQWAHAHALAVLKPQDPNEPGVADQLRALKADTGVVIAFGHKLSPSLVEALGGLAINLHASLLPKYRGAAPINWAILRGETETGVSVISLAQRMDAGLLFAQTRAPIDPLATAGELHDLLAELGPGAVADVLARFAEGKLRGVPQDDSLASKAPKLSKADGRVDFTNDADIVRRQIHGMTPWPGVEVICQPLDQTSKPYPLKLLRARPDKGSIAAPIPAAGTVIATGASVSVACGCGFIELLRLQVPGGLAMDTQDFLRGHKLASGDRLGVPD